MFTKDPDSNVFKRIFSEFNRSLFGTVPTPAHDRIAEDGDYEDEIQKFKSDLLADRSIEEPADVEPLLPEFDLPEDSELDNVQPTPPTVQHDRRVSISVTSHVSTKTVASSSQVSKVVSGCIDLSPVESEVEEASPPSPDATRPASKKGGRSNATKKAKATPLNPPTRTLRNRK